MIDQKHRDSDHATTTAASPDVQGGSLTLASGLLQRKIQRRAAQRRDQATVQLRVDESARQEGRAQHEKRGKDTPSEEDPLVHATFTDEPKAPELHHDHGFLDDGKGNLDPGKREAPTMGDRLSKLKWLAKLEAAEALRPDLVDGTTAYRHFLFGGGATRPFNYERFLRNDSSGKTVLASAIEDLQQGAVEHHDKMIGNQCPAPGVQTFHFRSQPLGVGTDGRYPYPATENWQKALGAHQLWIEADVEVTILASAGAEPPLRQFKAEMTIHVEDMYNFNPGAADIATGTPDADNGRFEITGLGHEFLQTASVKRSVLFSRPLLSAAPAATPSGGQVSGGPRLPPAPPPDSR